MNRTTRSLLLAIILLAMLVVAILNLKCGKGGKDLLLDPHEKNIKGDWVPDSLKTALILPYPAPSEEPQYVPDFRILKSKDRKENV